MTEILKEMLSKLENKFQYELTRLHEMAARLVAAFFTRFPFLLKKSPTKDLLLLPYYPRGNVGTRVRFEIYRPFLEEDGVTYDIEYVADLDEMYDAFYCPHHARHTAERFRFMRRFLWSRLLVCLRASEYRAIYVQRAMIPSFPHLKSAFLMKLMARLNDNITLDFYDADYLSNPELVYSSVKYADKLSVVNEVLKDHFAPMHQSIHVHPLALSAKPYKVKETYDISSPIRLFWTGTHGHLRNFEACIEALRLLNSKHDFTMVLITDGVKEYEGFPIERHRYDTSTFYDIMVSCDIGVFPVLRGDDEHRGAMAMKTLEYMAAGLPVVGAPWGLSPYLEENESILIATTTEDWCAALERTFSDKSLREKLGRNARKVYENHHESKVSYLTLKKILLG